MRNTRPPRPVLWAFAAAGVLALAVAVAQPLRFGEPEWTLAAVAPNPEALELIRAFESGAGQPVMGLLRLQRADGQVFYRFDPPCCDHFSVLYDIEGRRVCAPAGGFGGSGDGRCPGWVAGLRLSLPRWATGTQASPTWRAY